MPTLDAVLSNARAGTRSASAIWRAADLPVSAECALPDRRPGAGGHASGVPFDDASGERLCACLGVDRDTFCAPSRTALLPQDFC